MKNTYRRRNFFLALVITLFLWLALALIIFYISPEKFWAPPLFFIILFAATLFTASLLTNRLVGLITSILVTLILILRYFGFRF